MKIMHVNELREGKAIFLNAVRKLLIPSGKNIEQELEQTGKVVEKILLEILRDACSKIEGVHQRKAAYDTALFFLYTYHRDNAHHQQGNYFLHQVLEHKDELMKGLEWERRGFDYLKPEQWRVNMWMKSQKEKKQKKERDEERKRKKLEKTQ